MSDTVSTRFILNPNVICNILTLAYTAPEQGEKIIDCEYDSIILIRRLLRRLKIEEDKCAGTEFATHETFSNYHIVAGLVYMERIKTTHGRIAPQNVTILFVIAVYVAGKLLDDFHIGARSYKNVLGCESIEDVIKLERYLLEIVDHKIFLKKEEVIHFFAN